MSSNFVIGDNVCVGTGSDRLGTVAYVGETQFASGEWIGVILSSPLGKNDGSVNGITYFKCKPFHGIFSRPQNLHHVSSIDFCDVDQKTIPECEQFGDVGNRRISLSNQLPKSNSSVLGSQPLESPQLSFKLGDRVEVSGGRIGILRYIGPTDFAAGEWAGIELDDPLGKNDGSVGGKRYFTCKPNFGLFAASNKVFAPGSRPNERNLGTQQHRRSQESLISYCSNLSSVSRSYRAQYGPINQNRVTPSNNRRPSSVTNTVDQKEQLASIQSLQRLVREKEEHISQLLEERDMERSDLARITLDREQAHTEINHQRTEIERLNQQLRSMEAANQMLQDEHEQLLARLNEEKKALEDLQFRMEEENITKSTLESVNADDESKIFELEEALMFARETNERTEAELTRVREQVASLLAIQSQAAPESKGVEATVQLAVSGVQTTETTFPSVPKGCQTVVCGIEIEEAMAHVTPETKDAKVGSPSKSTLHHVSLVSQSSVPPTPMAIDPTLQAELDRLRRDLADREKITESALKRQADVLQTVTADYEKQVNDLNAQLLSASKALLTSHEECAALKGSIENSEAEFQKKLEDLTEKMKKDNEVASEKLVCYKNQLAELTAELERERGKTSTTVLEQAVQLRKVEEKLRITEHQLLELQTTTVAQAQANLDGQSDLIAQLESRNALVDELKARVEEQEAELRLQREKLAEQERKQSDAAQSHGNVEVDRLEAELRTSRADLVSAMNKQQELMRSLEEANTTRDQLLTQLSTLLGDGSLENPTSVEGLKTGLRDKLERLSHQVRESEAQQSALKRRIVELEQERTDLEQKFFELKSSLPLQETSAEDPPLSMQLNKARERISSLEASVANALENVNAKAAELQSVQAHLDQTLRDHAVLEQSHLRAISKLEKENSDLLQQIQSVQSPARNSSVSAANLATQQLSNLIEEKASADSQVNFLNSIIVDLHKKNAELEERVRCLLGDANGSPIKSKAYGTTAQRAPRRWCDNCLIFDSHETENCPTAPERNGRFTKTPKHKLSDHSLLLGSDRLYCDICGVFDQHATSECTNNDTF